MSNTAAHATEISSGPVESLSFEAAQAELEAIVERLEDQHTGLDDAIALWERGEALHRHCQAKLDYAAERIQRLQLSAAEVADVAAESSANDFAPNGGTDAGSAGESASGEPPTMF